MQKRFDQRPITETVANALFGQINYRVVQTYVSVFDKLHFVLKGIVIFSQASITEV